MREPLWNRSAMLSVRYRTVLFPFDPTGLFRLLPTLGYVLTEGIPTSVSPRQGVDVKGVVARKLDTSLSLNTDKQMLTVSSPELDTCLDEMDRIESAIGEELGIDSDSLSLFYELLAELQVRSPASPVEALSAQLESVPLVQALSCALGEDLQGFGLRLSSGAEPNAANWVDIQISPEIRAPQDSFTVNVVFRNVDRKEVFEFGRALGSGLMSVLAGREA